MDTRVVLNDVETTGEPPGHGCQDSIFRNQWDKEGDQIAQPSKGKRSPTTGRRRRWSWAQGGMTGRIVPPTSCTPPASEDGSRFRGSGPRLTGSLPRMPPIACSSPAPPGSSDRTCAGASSPTGTPWSASTTSPRAGPTRSPPRRRWSSCRQTCATRPPSTSTAARGCTTVYHQGAKRSVPRSMDEPALFTEVNVRRHAQRPARGPRSRGRRRERFQQQRLRGPERVPVARVHARRVRGAPYAASKLATEVYCAGLWRSLRRAGRVPAVLQRLRSRPIARERVRRGGPALRGGLHARRTARRSTATVSRPATSPTSTTSSKRTCGRRRRPSTPTGWRSTSAEEPSPPA